MQKKFALFIIISFLSVQMVSVFHMAEHAFEEHEHNGQTCEIYLQAKQDNTADIPKAVKAPEMTELGSDVQSFHIAIIVDNTHKTSIPRAPPFSSLT